MNKNNLFNEDKPKKSLPCILPSSTEDKDKKIVAIPLESNHDFLELFSIKSKQCFHVNIPDVLLIDDESFQKTIIFNQITSKTLTIISKPIESSKNFLNNLRNKSNNTTLYNKKKPMMKFQQRILQALIRFTSVYLCFFY